MENRIYGISDQEFISLVKSSLNISEVLFKLGYSVKGNSWGFGEVKKRMTDLNLSGYDFKGKNALKQPINKAINPDKLLCEHSKHARKVLRSYIIKNNLIPYKCSICGITEWNGKTLSLELDHINGINDDNRLENLRFLCPNCHSQTDTYGARNSKVTEAHYDISDELSSKICSFYIQLKNIEKVAKKLGLMPKAVNQCLTEAGIKKTNQKYVIQYDKNHKVVNRFGSLSECGKWLMDNGFVKTRLMKTCKNTLKRNAGKLWNDYYFEILDAQRIKHNL